MKLSLTKKLITTILIGTISFFNSTIVLADDINNVANSSDSSDEGDNTVKVPAQSSDAIGNMLLQSVSLMGIAYKWGGNTPDTGMDCSGFVRYVFKKSLGINLPRTAAEMAKVGKRVSIDDLEPGDLIFFNTRRGSNTHIGIYLGNNKFIQSPRTGENIQITELNGYWVKHFNGAKRVIQEDQDDSGKTTVENYSDIHDEALPTSYRSSRSRHGKHGRSSRTLHKKATKASKSASSKKRTRSRKSAKKKGH